MRFYELNGGEIRIDGKKYRRPHPGKRPRPDSAWSSRTPGSLKGTIRENIVYSKEGVTDEAGPGRHARLWVWIISSASCPQGYDTQLNDRANLSAGQKQLVTIARAMIENAPLLILDEATSSVDTRTEALVQAAMDKLTENRTSFVIAHRLSTIRNADLILVLKDGDIVESGNHQELLAKGGFYASLYNSQFENTVA